MIDPSKYELAKAQYLSRSLRAHICNGVSEDQKNNVYAGYCESFLMMLAVRYPEVRKEMEDRIVYQEYNR